jgi:hypothetical protein
MRAELPGIIGARFRLDQNASCKNRTDCYPALVKRLFSREDDFARKAGQSRSPAKRRAARKNGQKGGRKRTRTLAEFLLRRRIADYQRQAVTRAINDTLSGFGLSEHEFLAYFGCWDDDDEEEALGDEMPHATNFKRPPGRIRQDILVAVRVFRVLANQELKKLGSPKPPRDYVVRYVPKEHWEQEDWERTHPDGPPCPPRRERVYFKSMRAYITLKLRLSRNPDYFIPSAHNMYDEFGSQVADPKVAEAIADSLRQEFPRKKR